MRDRCTASSITPPHMTHTHPIHDHHSSLPNTTTSIIAAQGHESDGRHHGADELPACVHAFVVAYTDSCRFGRRPGGCDGHFDRRRSVSSLRPGSINLPFPSLTTDRPQAHFALAPNQLQWLEYDIIHVWGCGVLTDRQGQCGGPAAGGITWSGFAESISQTRCTAHHHAGTVRAACSQDVVMSS